MFWSNFATHISFISYEKNEIFLKTCVQNLFKLLPTEHKLNFLEQKPLCDNMPLWTILDSKCEDSLFSKMFSHQLNEITENVKPFNSLQIQKYYQMVNKPTFYTYVYIDIFKTQTIFLFSYT